MALKKAEDEYEAIMIAEDQKGIRRHAWSQEEDDLLLQAVMKVTNTSPETWGASDTPSSAEWSEIVRLVPGRTKKQCRERWDNKVNPGISPEDWSTDEILRVFLLHKKHGNKWRAIALDMPGRTALQCRNCYHSQQSALRKKFPHIFAELEDGRASSSSLASAVESMRPEYSEHGDGRRKRRSHHDNTVADFGVADHLGAPAEDIYAEHDDSFAGLGHESALLPAVESMVAEAAAHSAAVTANALQSFEGHHEATHHAEDLSSAADMAAESEIAHSAAAVVNSEAKPAGTASTQPAAAGAQQPGLSAEALDAAVALLAANPYPSDNGKESSAGSKRKTRDFQPDSPDGNAAKRSTADAKTSLSAMLS